MKQALLVSMIVFTIAGCAPMQDSNALRRSPETVSADVEQTALEPLACKDKEQCDLYWQRAQYWVSTYSAFKIQSATDTAIVTYGPRQYGGELAYSVRKEVSTMGGATLHVNAYCDSPKYGCFEHPLSAIARAKTYIKSKD